jgi:hypothetical protein
MAGEMFFVDHVRILAPEPPLKESRPLRVFGLLHKIPFLSGLSNAACILVCTRMRPLHLKPMAPEGSTIEERKAIDGPNAVTAAAPPRTTDESEWNSAVYACIVCDSLHRVR